MDVDATAFTATHLNQGMTLTFDLQHQGHQLGPVVVPCKFHQD